ncbi:MAG: hypothetical protein JWN40_2001 [Phycisphaerales bacterium]|jgi:hypothetical protein|nr:hypothetical protein [Phycisphaerales bacterium]
MDKKTFGIGVLSITGMLLLIACLLPAKPADAAFAVKDRDYQVITVPSVGGGDTVYVVDNRTGLMAVLAFDNRARVLRPKQVRAVADAFQ